jgi:hypothetical protein
MLANVTFESVSRVSVLDDQAFAFCSSLASICIPSSVTRIGRQCFLACAGLATVSVGSGIRVAVGDSAFYRCSSALRLPAALTARLSQDRSPRDFDIDGRYRSVV